MTDRLMLGVAYGLVVLMLGGVAACNVAIYQDCRDQGAGQQFCRRCHAAYMRRWRVRQRELIAFARRVMRGVGDDAGVPVIQFTGAG